MIKSIEKCALTAWQAFVISLPAECSSSYCDLFKLKVSVRIRWWMLRLLTENFPDIFPHFSTFRLIGSDFLSLCCFSINAVESIVSRDSSSPSKEWKNFFSESRLWASRNANGTIMKRRTMVPTMKINIRYPIVLMEWRWRDEMRRMKHKQKINQSKDLAVASGEKWAVNGCSWNLSRIPGYQVDRGDAIDRLLLFFRQIKFHRTSSRASLKGFFCLHHCHVSSRLVWFMRCVTAINGAPYNFHNSLVNPTQRRTHSSAVLLASLLMIDIDRD